MIRDEYTPKNVASVFGIDDALLLASMASSAGGAIMANNSAKRQQALEQQAYEQQRALSDRQLDLQDKINKQSLATTIDALGNVTYYDEATNTWKSLLAPTQQNIQNLSDAETIAQLKGDAPRARIEDILNAMRRSREGSVADTALYQVQDRLANPVNAGSLESALRLNRQQAVNAGFDQVGSNLATQALRSGATGGGALATALAKGRSQAYAQTMGSPQTEALQLADDLQANRVGNSMNAYSSMRSLATGAPATTFNPTNVGASLSNALSNAKAGALQGGQAAGQLGQSAASILGSAKLPTVPNDGAVWAAIGNAIGSSGDLLSSLMKNRKASTTKKSNVSTYGPTMD